MELHGTVSGGIIVPDDPSTLPEEGTRVRIDTSVISSTPEEKRVHAENGPGEPGWFLKKYARFIGAIDGLPSDLSDQHDHYRLGTPKR